MVIIIQSKLQSLFQARLCIYSCWSYFPCCKVVFPSSVLLSASKHIISSKALLYLVLFSKAIAFLMARVTSNQLVTQSLSGYHRSLGGRQPVPKLL